MELLMVIAIFSVLFSVSASVYSNFKSHSNLEVTTNGVVEAVRLAQSSAQSGKDDSKWGVKILSNEVVVFRGNDYLGRVVSADQPLGFSGEINASGLLEIVFEKMTGETLTTGTVILTNSDGTKNININAKGTITY